MTDLKHAVKNGIKILEREASKKVKDAIRDDSLDLWKGYKVIPVSKWESMKGGDQHKMLEYMPEDFVEYPFFYFPRGDDTLPKKREEWYKNYLVYLEEKKISSYGEYRCRRCILHPGSIIRNDNLRQVMIKGLKDENGPLKSPCQVVNIYNCPYEQSGDDNTLLFLGDIWKVVEDALNCAESLTAYNNETYEADFEKKWVDEYYDIRFSPNTWGTIQDTLGHLKIAKIPINSIKDIYHILTNRKTLEQILDQYISNVEEDDYEDKSTIERKAKFLKSMKKHVLNYFIKIKSEIKIEDIRDLDKRNLEEEKEHFKKHEEFLKWAAKNDRKVDLSRIGSGKCVLCEQFSNIHCTNCDIWVCIDHWRQHGIEVHNYQSE